MNMAASATPRSGKRDSQPALGLAPPVGLSSAEAERRLAQFGRNELRRARSITPLTLLARQFASPVIWLLVAASVLSAALGEVLDAVAIGAIVLVNGAIGFFQEYRAERAVMALRSMTAPRARVMRDGHSLMLPADVVVLGDLLVLEAGDVAAADARLYTANGLTTNEAPLTGESAPVAKDISPTEAGTPLAERHDFVFMGTSVTTGTGFAEVVATGMQTELGRIAHLLATAVETVTPLQRRLAKVSQTLLYICGGIVAVVALAGLLRGWPLMQVFMAAVSLAVAAVPEGLPAVVTIALAVGVQRMAARNVLVRRLPAVETLGCATVICTDKTGTLTTGIMRVRELWGRDHGTLLSAAAACCDAEIGRDGRAGIGDPTEVAILLAAAERGIDRAEIERTNARLTVTPFDAVSKRMSIERADGGVYIKGAVESVLPLCVEGTDDIAQANAQMAEGCAESSRTETDAVRRRYDRSAARYEFLTWPMEVMAMDRYRARLIAKVKGPRVLEVGVGTGRNLPLYRDDVHVDAIDLSPRMLERARRRPARHNVELALMDVQALPWPAGTFDTVVATCAFCSVPDPVKGLAELRRVLRPDGQALFLEHVRPGTPWLARVFDWLDPVVSRSGPHINRRTMDNIRNAGFAVEREDNLMSDVLKLVVAHP